MKNIVIIIFTLFCLNSFSQTLKIKKRQEDKYSKYFVFKNQYGNKKNNVILSYNFIDKKISGIYPYQNYKFQNNRTSCMWCFLAPVAAGVLYYQSYISFKNGSKTDGYVALGVGTGLTLFSVYYFFPRKREKNK